MAAGIRFHALPGGLPPSDIFFRFFPDHVEIHLAAPTYP